LEIDVRQAAANKITVGEDALSVDLADGTHDHRPHRLVPRLARGTLEQRSNWQLIGKGEGIHWPDLDDDISVESLLAGRRSTETSESLHEWLRARTADYFRERAALPNAKRILKRSGKGNPPIPGDEIE
jgi:Protein of unknown function (DUF2442)